MSLSEVALRQSVVAYARQFLGCLDPTPFWADACPAAGPKNHLSWCGVFALSCLRQCGLTDWIWHLGRGFIYCDDDGKQCSARLPIVKVPEVGDIAYFDHPFQHYALVTGVDGTTVHLIAGNTPNVSECSCALSKPTAFYSIVHLLAKCEAQS
jgi:hypothetical protein